MEDCRNNCPIKDGGYCERHKVSKTNRWVQLCLTKEKYWKSWESGVGPGQGLSFDEPSMLEKLANFAKALGKHVSEGMPTCTQEEVDYRLSICKLCKLFVASQDDPNRGFCKHKACGCNISKIVKFLNKLAWADQKCPLNKWGPIEKKSEEGV